MAMCPVECQAVSAMFSELPGVHAMASKKKQQQKKNKLRTLKKKKKAENKILEGRLADPGEKKGGERGHSKPSFGGMNATGRQGAKSGPSMHRPQGG